MKVLEEGGFHGVIEMKGWVSVLVVVVSMAGVEKGHEGAYVECCRSIDGRDGEGVQGSVCQRANDPVGPRRSTVGIGEGCKGVYITTCSRLVRLMKLGGKRLRGWLNNDSTTASTRV